METQGTSGVGGGGGGIELDAAFAAAAQGDGLARCDRDPVDH